MKILIIGPGIIGSIYGWALSQEGYDVTHLVHKEKIDKFPNGIKLDMLDGRKGKKNFIGTYNIKLTEKITTEDNYDLVIIPTKPYQLLDALTQVAPLAPNAQFLLLTQNWNGTAEIDKILPRSRYIFGDAHAGGSWKDAVLVASFFKDIVIGAVDPTGNNVLSTYKTLFENIKLQVVIPENILHYIWVQYAISAGLWTGLVRDGSLQKLLLDQKTGLLTMRSVKECSDVIVARGINLDKYPEIKIYLHATSYIGALVVSFIIKSMFFFNKAIQRSSAHGLADPLEIKETYENVLRTGHQLGVTMPNYESFSTDIEQLQHK
jgi:ketopantoate reductase